VTIAEEAATPADAETISLKDCAERLGVHYMTAYRYVRIGRLPAVKVGSEWRVSVADLEDFVAGSEAKPGRGEVRWAERLEGRMRAGDEPGSWQVIEAAMASGMAPEQIYLEVIGPAMRRIGDAWHDGRASIAEEHRASAIAVRMVGRLGPRFRARGRRRGRIVLGTPPGERHALAVAMLADMYRAGGFEVMELGADLPSEEFLDAAAGVDSLTAVVISASSSINLDTARDLVSALKERLEVPVLIGGVAIRDAAHALSLGADAFAATAPEAVAWARSLVAE
jgi:excisionase family DNA binding protein